MSGRQRRAVWFMAGWLAGLAAPVDAQWMPPAPPPAPADPGVQDCVVRLGNPGCAARLYGELLCSAVGTMVPVDTLRIRLEREYQWAGIDFQGMTPTQIEDLALVEHVPVLCPTRSRQIHQLFWPQGIRPAG